MRVSTKMIFGSRAQAGRGIPDPSGQQLVREGVGDSASAAGDIELGKDVLDVVFCGTSADGQRLADVWVGRTVGEQSQNLQLARGEGRTCRWARRVRALGTGRRLRGRAERGNAGLVETLFAGEVGRAIGCPLGPKVGGGEQSRTGRHAPSREPERISRAVEAFMVGADVGGQVGERMNPGENALAVVRV